MPPLLEISTGSPATARFRTATAATGTFGFTVTGQYSSPPSSHTAAASLTKRLGAVRGVEILVGPEATERLARESDADMILNAMVGAVGRLVGVMIESHLKAGRQDLVPGKALNYGQSITDACLGWDESVALLDEFAHAVAARRSFVRIVS